MVTLAPWMEPLMTTEERTWRIIYLQCEFYSSLLCLWKPPGHLNPMRRQFFLHFSFFFSCKFADFFIRGDWDPGEVHMWNTDLALSYLVRFTQCEVYTCFLLIRADREMCVWSVCTTLSVYECVWENVLRKCWAVSVHTASVFFFFYM